MNKYSSWAKYLPLISLVSRPMPAGRADCSKTSCHLTTKPDRRKLSRVESFPSPGSPTSCQVFPMHTHLLQSCNRLDSILLILERSLLAVDSFLSPTCVSNSESDHLNCVLPESPVLLPVGLRCEAHAGWDGPHGADLGPGTCPSLRS